MTNCGLYLLVQLFSWLHLHIISYIFFFCFFSTVSSVFVCERVSHSVTKWTTFTCSLIFFLLLLIWQLPLSLISFDLVVFYYILFSPSRRPVFHSHSSPVGQLLSPKVLYLPTVFSSHTHFQVSQVKRASSSDHKREKKKSTTTTNVVKVVKNFFFLIKVNKSFIQSGKIANIIQVYFICW